MKKIYSFLCLAGLLLAGCEGWIEVDYPKNQISITEVFEDTKTANAALASLYAMLRDQSVVCGGSMEGTGSMLGTYTDDLDSYFIYNNNLYDVYNNQLQATNSYVKAVWNASYQQIYYANAIIYGVEHSNTLPVDFINCMKGEALFIRSLVYFYLQQLFGDIPYTTTLDYEYNRTIGKTDAAKILEQLESDVLEAYNLLEDEYRDKERIYANRKTAELLLAKIYLTSREYEKAENMAALIFKSPLYEFEKDVNEVFHKTGSHILWQLKPPKNGDSTLEAKTYYFENSVPKEYALTQDLVNAFDGNDLRKQVWMAEVTVDGNTWFRAYKYKNAYNITNDNEYSVIFRLEEAYFIMAEALAGQNKIDEAIPYLNATRERAGISPFTSLTKDEFENELLLEKRREFFTELGHRFLDLKRWGRLDDLRDIKPYWEEYKQLWPIPQNELLMNPNLNPQNQGY